MHRNPEKEKSGKKYKNRENKEVEPLKASVERKRKAVL
jgi:hypothetical protein